MAAFYYKYEWFDRIEQPTQKSPMLNEKPSFFKVLVNKDFKKLLRLPPSFLRRYDLNLPENVKMRVDDSGRRWTVKVERLNNGSFCFTKGWPKFAEDAALQLGEFLVFSLLPRSHFNVLIYETSFCQREIPTTSSNLVESNAHDVKVESEGIDENEISKRGRGRPRKRKRGNNPLPYFETSIKEHHRSRISLIKKFSVESNMKERKQVKMVYEGNRRGAVTVAVDHRPPGYRIDLAKGWPQFRNANLRRDKWYRFEFNPDDQVIYVTCQESIAPPSSSPK